MSFLAPFSDSRIIPGKGGILPGLHPFPGRIVVLAVRCHKVWNLGMYSVTVGAVKTPEIKRQLAPGFILDVSAFAIFNRHIAPAIWADNGMVTISDFQILDFPKVNAGALNYPVQADFFTCLFFIMM